MTIEERIKRAQKNAQLSASIAQEADDEARGCEAIGLKDKAETCRDRERRHTERAAVWSAAARKLREQQESTNDLLWLEQHRVHVTPDRIDRAEQPAVSLSAADGTPYAEDQAHKLDAERNEALGLAKAI
jgi:hypothetical protein